MESDIYNAEKIAVVRTDRLGDMVLTLPMCMALKKELPSAKVVLIARSYAKSILKNCPAIDDVLFIDEFPNGIKSIFSENKFSAVFYPRPRFKECWAGFRVGISLRVGTSYRYYSFLFNHRIKDHRKNAEFHEAEYNTRMVSSVLGKQVETELVRPYVSPESVEELELIAKKAGLDLSKKYIIIHPGSGGSSRNWKAESFGVLANLIMDKYGFQTVITGSEEEQIYCDISEKLCPNSVNLCGKLSLEQLISLISRASILTANSTGVLHIAAALDIPVLGLYPNTPHLSAKRWGPYCKKSLTISPPDKLNPKFRDNMQAIEVSTVFEAAQKLLGT
ncbi:MAG: glycosyltransferase family 9 protein [Bacteroidota bacterium]